MPFSWDNYPYTNFHELNLDYFINKFKEIFDEWADLYNTLTTWKDTTTTELETWKTQTENDIITWENNIISDLNIWKSTTETNISSWETATLNALDAWKTATTAIFEAIRVEAAENATAAANSATTAATAKTAAETAQAAAEAAAASVTASAAQITTNANDIADIKNGVVFVGYSNNFVWDNGNISSSGTNNNTNAQYRVRTRGFIQDDNIEMLRCPQDTMFVIHMYSSDSVSNWVGVWTGTEFATTGGTWVKEFDFGKYQALNPTYYFRFVMQKDEFTSITPEYGKQLFIASYNNVYSKLINSVAKDYSEFTSYTAGEYCYYKGKLYIFISSKTAGEWDDTKVKEINILNDISKNNETILRIEDLLDSTKNYMFSNTWKRYTVGQGHTNEIGTSGYQYEPSTTRISTYNIQSLDSIISLTFKPDEGYKFGIHGFNSDLTERVFVTQWITEEYTPDFPDTTKYIIVVMANTSDSTITTDEYTHLQITGIIEGGKISDIENNLEMTTQYKKESKFDDFCNNFNVNGEVSSYLFFTDPHIYNKAVTNDTIDNLFHKLKIAYDSTPCNFIMCGGDWLQGGQKDIIPGGPTTDEACGQLGFVDGVMRKLYRKYKPIFGNHEFNINNVQLPLNTILNLMFSEEGSAYYDFKDRNTHYYVMDTGNNNSDTLSTYRKNQLNWLSEKLESNTEDHVIICCHIFYNTSSSNPFNATITDMGEALINISKAFNNKNNSYTAEWDDTKTYDFSNSTGTVHYLIAGHLHVDWIVENDGITTIMTANALYNWNEPTFDLIANDYVNNMVCMTRVGNGNNRYCHFNSVPVSNNETLTALKITPSTWASSDTSIATVSDGVVTAVASGNALITATDSNGNIETWAVIVS